MNNGTWAERVPWQERVIEEKAEVDKRLMRLHLFIDSDAYRTLDNRARLLMAKQRDVMAQYSQILAQRLGLIE